MKKPHQRAWSTGEKIHEYLVSRILDDVADNAAIKDFFAVWTAEIANYIEPEIEAAERDAFEDAVRWCRGWLIDKSLRGEKIGPAEFEQMQTTHDDWSKTR